MKETSMKNKVRNLKDTFCSYFPFVFFILLAQGLRRSHGALKSNHLSYITISLFVLLFISFVKHIDFRVPSKKVMKYAYVLFSFFWLVKNEIIYAEPGVGTNLNRLFVGANLFLSLGLLYFELRNIKSRLIYYLIGIAQLGIFITIIFSSPSPIMDVYTIMTEGADHLLAGRNPYRFTYPDIYNGLYAYVPRFIYWPVVTYGFVLSRFLFTDIRAIFIIIYALMSYFHFNQFKMNKDSFELSSLKTIMWISFPVSIFVVEQAWVEVFLIPFVYFHFLYLSKRDWIKAAVFLGLLCATKQFLIFTCILSFFYVYKQDSFKKALTFTAVCTLVLVILMTPFLLWDSSVFIENTVLQFLSYPPRWDSLSWVAHFKRFYGVYLNSKITGGIYLAASLLSIFLIFKSKININKLLVLNIFLYGIVFIFGKQSFCNYYYFLAYFIFLLMTNTYKKDLSI
eukprot:GHVO01008921.1.p1 GENE.GHVO01008921.1~~GHVO01008921.1.p1  ORF type:complete len:453 (-),score=-50.44 GHVO01008921.1:699-2057(-)